MHFPALPVRQGHGMNSGQWTLAEVMDVKSQLKHRRDMSPPLLHSIWKPHVEMLVSQMDIRPTDLQQTWEEQEIMY